MNKYHVYLADNYTKSEPFFVDWNYELIGDKLRAEFDVYFTAEEKKAKAGTGKTKRLLRGEFIKKFMISKRVNLVDNPSNGNLKSVFILRKGEKKVVDKRAKDDLAIRFQWKERKDSDGEEISPEGLMKFALIEGTEEVDKTKPAPFQVEGNDIEYFEETIKPSEEVEEVVKIVKEKFTCEVCGKVFDSKRALHGHSLHHKKEQK